MADLRDLTGAVRCKAELSGMEVSNHLAYGHRLPLLLVSCQLESVMAAFRYPLNVTYGSHPELGTLGLSGYSLGFSS